MFMPASWQFILYGMEFKTDLSHARAAYARMDDARKEFAMIQTIGQRAVADLPTHRALVDRMCAR